jgi:hypothetical protein
LHALPHPPQLFGSSAVSTAQLVPVIAQSAFGGVHVSTHLLFVQTEVPPVAEHTLPHFPQLFSSVVRLVSQPTPAATQCA